MQLAPVMSAATRCSAEVGEECSHVPVHQQSESRLISCSGTVISQTATAFCLEAVRLSPKPSPLT